MQNERLLVSKNLRKFPDLPGHNSSFLTTPNILWFHFVLNWVPDPSKPLVFLPCASAQKTRLTGDGRKYISQSTSHQFLSAITRNKNYEKVILSEPLTVIPYRLERHSRRPDYNLPVRELSIQSEFVFIHQLSLWLAKTKITQPYRSVIFYIGPRHHYFILYFSNLLAGSPFEIIYKIPERGIRDYASAARSFRLEINEYLSSGEFPIQPVVSFEKHLRTRGRYTNKKFWHFISTLRKEKPDRIDVCDPQAYIGGFDHLYQEIINV